MEFKDPLETGFPPEMFLDTESGQATGVGPELCRLMAQDLGVDLNCVDIPWPEHIDALLAGEVDLTLGTNTPDRALRIDFVPWRLMENRVTGLATRGAEISSAELDSPDQTLVCWHGSSIVAVARKHFPQATVIESTNPPQAIRSGQASAFITDSVTYRLLEILDELSFVMDGGAPLLLSREFVHFAINPGDTRFMTWLVNWHDFHDAQGTVGAWCDTYWESHMADTPTPDRA